MLNDFSWNLTGYIPKHQVNPHGDGIVPYVAERIFHLEPEPQAVDSLNEYILSALHEKNLKYFSFFLHYYEPQLNKRIKAFLGVDGEETGEDVALDDTWNYTDILWNDIQAEKVQRAFEKLNYREQTLLEKRLAICMTCGRVGSWKGRPTFEELAVMFEGSTASGAERAYRKAVDKLTELLVAEGAIHAVRLKQKSKTKHKKKTAAAIY